MKGFLNFVFGWLVIVGLVNACTDGSDSKVSAQQRILESRLVETDGNRSALNRTVEGRRGQVAELEHLAYRQQQEITQFRGAVEAYMLDHKMAIAALVVGGTSIGVALDENNAFTPDEQFLGGVVSLVAVAYAFANWDEVVAVADQLFQADAHFKRLEAQLAGTRQALQGERNQLAQEEQQLAALALESDQIRAELAALG